MGKPKNPGGRPKGSRNKRRAPARPGIDSRRNVQPCPNLRNPGHGADCPECGGSGEVRKK